MTYEEIIKKIQAGLSGDKQQDQAYLKQQMEEYKDHRYNHEIVRECGRMLYDLLDDAQKEKFVRSIEQDTEHIRSALKEVEYFLSKKDAAKANEVILNNKVIHCFYPEDADLYDYRSKKEINEAIRLVEIEGVDCCACCAPHVRSTSEIGMIKILKAMKHKNGIRLYFVCGHRAFVDYQAKHLQAINISQKLSLPPDNLVKGIDQLLNENNQLKQELSSLKKQIIDQQVQSLPQQDHYLIFTNNLDRSLQQYYLNQLFPLCSNYVAIFVGKDENYRFIIASNNDSRELLNKLKGHFEIKGGGKANMVQGQIKGNQKTIQDILENN